MWEVVRCTACVRRGGRGYRPSLSAEEEGGQTDASDRGRGRMGSLAFVQKDEESVVGVSRPPSLSWARAIQRHRIKSRLPPSLPESPRHLFISFPRSLVRGRPRSNDG